MAPESPSGATRDYARVALVVLCVLATVLAAGLVPALSSSGVVGSPAQSLFPGSSLSGPSGGGSGNGSSPSEEGDWQSVTRAGDEGTGSQGGASGGGLGALNPNSNTDVGGSIGSDTFRSQETSVHLVVRSTESAYWRTGAYDRYTGSGWSRQNPTAEPYEGPIESSQPRGERVNYRVTLNRTATALPTVWRPNTVAGVNDVRVTDQRAVEVAGSVGPGTTYSGVSYRPPRDPSVLRTSDQSYPEAVEDRYTALPDDTSPRIERLTNRVAASADTPYGEAQAIEAWLETNKSYSLNVSQRSDNIAETFIFEMERGYCEYFATSMVVMLRSQDIPARYVVGYSTGQKVAPNTYQVRGMNAHAWVEVYFEDVGWVKFDPTPGSDRLQQERQSLQEADSEENYAPQEEGSPGETLTPNNESSNTDDSEQGNDTGNETSDTGDPRDEGTTNETEGQTEAGYDVSLNRSAVPGATVEVSVTRDGTPVTGRTVYFNGERVDRTGPDGTAAGTVPYTEELRIRIDDPTPGESLAPLGPRTNRFYRLPAAGGGPGDVTFPVETNATVTVTGDRVAGNAVTVTATVDDVPVRNATVLLDGDPAGRTDANGRTTVRLPERPGNVTIAVERSPVRGETTVSIPHLNVSVDPSTPLALPLGTATVNVTAGGAPVDGASVQVGGQTVATTDIDGTATVRFPFASGVTVGAEAYGLSTETQVSGLFVNLLFVLAGVLFLVGLPFLAAARRGYRPREILALLARLPGTAVQYAQVMLVTLATRGDELLVRAIRRLWLAAAAIADLLRGDVSASELRRRLMAWLRTRWAALHQGDGEGVPRSGDRTARSETDRARLTIRRAWQRFLRQVSLRRPSTRTPGEIARHAIDRDGLPHDAVRTLRDAFREVEYGKRSAADRVDRAERALAAIEGERGVDEPQTDGGDSEGSAATQSDGPDRRDG
jgi:transglutaminase-like putative cysteine protease